MTSRSNPQAEHVFALIDAQDAHGFLELLADDARLFFGNAEPMAGRDGITAGVGEFYASIAALHHEVVDTWTSSAHTIARAAVTYRRLDGK